MFWLGAGISEDGQAVEQVAPESCAASILQGYEKQTR